MNTSFILVSLGPKTWPCFIRCSGNVYLVKGSQYCWIETKDPGREAAEEPTAGRQGSFHLDGLARIPNKAIKMLIFPAPPSASGEPRRL